jgi:hypothetical protein
MSMTVEERVQTREVPRPEPLAPAAVTAQVPAFNTVPEPPGPVEKALLLTGWFLVERFVAVVLFFKKGEFH